MSVVDFSHKIAVCLRKVCEAALEEKHVMDISQVEGFVDESDISHLEQLEALRTLFKEAEEADMPTEVSTLVPLFIYLFIYFFMSFYFIMMWWEHRLCL